MTAPRLFLVAPSNKAADHVLACALAAAQEGDVASIVVPDAILADVVQHLQEKGIAVLRAADHGEARGADGVQVSDTGLVKQVRRELGHRHILGCYCGTSRHAAMQAGEDGADYVALSQIGRAVGEPIIAWWSALFEIPCVAYDPVDPGDLDILLPQNPDFIRPLELMWESADEARRIVSTLSRLLNQT
jgi:thiamine-phosphate pyrophosphorylase